MVPVDPFLSSVQLQPSYIQVWTSSRPFHWTYRLLPELDTYVKRPSLLNKYLDDWIHLSFLICRHIDIGSVSHLSNFTDILSTKGSWKNSYDIV